MFWWAITLKSELLQWRSFLNNRTKTKRVFFFFTSLWLGTSPRSQDKNCQIKKSMETETDLLQTLFKINVVFSRNKQVRVVKWWQNFQNYKIELLWWRRFLNRSADQKPRGLERDFSLVIDTLRATMMKERVYMCESVSWGSTLAFYEANAS